MKEETSYRELNSYLLILMTLLTLLFSGCLTSGTFKSKSEITVQEPDLAKGGHGIVLPDSTESKISRAEVLHSKEETIKPLLDAEKKFPSSRVPLEYIASSNFNSKIPLNGKNSNNSLPQKEEEPIHAEFTFDNADLHDVLNLVLYENFKIDYMVDPSIKAKVSFHISGDFTKKDIIDQLNSVLQLSSLAVVQGPGNIMKIVYRKDAPSSITLNRKGETYESAGDVTQLLRLRYINVAEINNKIQPFLSKSASVVIDIMNNSLVITDRFQNIENAAAIIGIMDVPFFKDLSWKIFPVKQANSEDIVNDIDKIFKSQGFYSRAGMSPGGYYIVPLNTINAVFVLTKWPEVITMVENWIDIMDRADESSTDVFVYFVENSSAIELAAILNQVYGGEKPKENKQTIVEPDKQQKQVVPTSGELSGNVEIIPDETNNAIVFKATAKDYAIIKKTLEQLDIVSRQVLLNVVVAEVTLDNSTEFGVQWFLKNNVGNYSGHALLDINDSLQTVTTGLGSTTGLSYGVFDSTDVLRGLVTAIGKDSKVSILSTPNLLAVDNKEAEIEVGEDVPTITGTVTDANGGVTNTVQYKKTGIILTVTPHINSSGLVKLDLVQEVSEKGSLDKELNNYSILNRKVTTSLVVEDKQSIFMGGMMRYNNSYSDAGVPFLKDIPLLGYFFKNSTDTTTKTELVFLITPHVIRNRREADRITKEFSENIESITRLLEKQEK